MRGFGSKNIAGFLAFVLMVSCMGTGAFAQPMQNGERGSIGLDAPLVTSFDGDATDETLNGERGVRISEMKNAAAILRADGFAAAGNKTSMRKDFVDFAKAEAGEDYPEDELIFRCERMEDAEAIADAYETVIGRAVTVKDCEFGICVLQIGEVITANLFAEDLGEIMEISADTENCLPQLYPNYDMEIEMANTDFEQFSDPYLFSKTATGTLQRGYQWHHELIGSKTVWKAIENKKLTTSTGQDFESALSDAVVAVVDSGINKIGKDFKYTIDEEERTNYVGGYSFVSPDYNDENGHGSNVAGIIADGANSFAGRGVASGVKIMPVRVTDAAGHATTANVCRAVRYITDARLQYDGRAPLSNPCIAPAYNVRVANFSIGGYSYSSLYEEYMKDAIHAGITVCASAGNDSMAIRHYPSDYEGVICVAAVNYAKEKSYFSNYGSRIDLCAPGGGYRYDEATEDYVMDYVYASGNTSAGSVSGRGGTSQASPMVASTAVLLSVMHPNWNPAQILYQMKRTAESVSDPGLGAGLVRADRALGLENENVIVLPSAYDKTTVAPGTRLQLSSSNEEAAVFYTLDGTKPDPANAVDVFDQNDPTGTFLYHPEEEDSYPVLFTDPQKNKCELTLQPSLYGRLGNAVSYHYQGSKAVTGVSISTEYPVSKLAVGGQLQLQAVVTPSYAKNKAVIWESSDPSVATVNKNGLVKVTAAAAAAQNVTITARSKEKSSVADSISFEIIDGVKEIAVKEPTGYPLYAKNGAVVLWGAQRLDSETILPTEGSEYDLSVAGGNILVRPEGALTQLSYRSSNPSVLKVDQSGRVTALNGGQAFVTIKNMDGKGAQTKQNFFVHVPVYSAEIRRKNSSPIEFRIVEGGKFIPKLVYNNGTATPENVKVTWSITNGNENAVAAIDPKTGILKSVKKKLDRAYQIEICAVMESSFQDRDGVIYHDPTKTVYQTITICPRIQKLSLRENGDGHDRKDSRYYYEDGVLHVLLDSAASRGVWYQGLLNDIVSIAPDTTVLGHYKIKSSAPKVFDVAWAEDDYYDNYFLASKCGKATLTLKALDGSGKKLKIPVVVENLQSKATFTSGAFSADGSNVIYPGKTLCYKPEAYCGLQSRQTWWSLQQVPKDKLSLAVTDSGLPVVSEDDCFVVKDGLITMKKVAVPEELTQKDLYVYQIFDYWYTDGGRWVYDKLKEDFVNIEVYANPVKKIMIYDSPDESARALVQKLEMRCHEESKRIYPESYPKDSCQKHYTYTSSNPKVAIVAEDGTITALKKGSATITVTAGDGSKKRQKMKVIVAD